MFDWLLAFIAAAGVVAIILWAAYILLPVIRMTML